MLVSGVLLDVVFVPLAMIDSARDMGPVDQKALFVVVRLESCLHAVVNRV